MTTLQNNPFLVYIMAAGFALLIGLILVLGIFAVQRNSQRSAYDAQLEDLLDNELEEGKTKVTLVTRWNRYWAERFKGMGWAKYADDESKAGRDTLVIASVAALIISVVIRNPLAGVGITLAGLYIASMIMKGKADREADKINMQLPGFLFALKANVQANETPERAILKVVDNMPLPLYNDLVIVKQRILANSSFKDALQELSGKTTSRDLRFLCACMIQATGTGANLEDQLTVIQNVLEARRKVSDELSKAIRSATPAIWVASFVIPITFVVTYMMDTNASKFWFTDIISWAALGAVGILYLAGIWLSKKLVDNIKNL